MADSSNRPVQPPHQWRLDEPTRPRFVDVKKPDTRHRRPPRATLGQVAVLILIASAISFLLGSSWQADSIRTDDQFFSRKVVLEEKQIEAQADDRIRVSID